MTGSTGERFIGLMSGTSLDGIDAVLVDFAGETPALLAAQTTPFDGSLRAALLALCHPGAEEIERLGTADRLLGEALSDAVLDLLRVAGVAPAMVRAIGSHGQTVRHRPTGPAAFTLQIGDPATVVERTGITTIADFRRRDIAAGGQGAPLAPAFHAALFSGPQPRAIVNIGGMANVSLLAPGRPLLGFDTGPGNVLLDAWASCHLQTPYDAHGTWAATGRVDETLLGLLTNLPFFQEPPPKSTGRELFHITWLQDTLTAHGGAPSAVDVQATLAELSASTIAQAIKGLDCAVTEVYVCGGGAYNDDLMARLAQHLGLPVASTDALGVAPEWVEAIAFAWLARQTLAGRVGNAASVTGAARDCILGAIHLADRPIS